MGTLLRAVRKASVASRAAAAAARRAAAMESRSARASAVAATATAASLASRAAAAAARRAAAMASRSGSARAAAVAATTPASALKACPCHGDASTELRSCFPTQADYAQMPDDAKIPTDEDMQSDEATWALYERWCKAFRKQRDRDEMARRFKIFKYNATMVHDWNSVPEDPMEAAIFLKKRREAKLLLSKGENVSHFDDGIVPYELGALCDGGDPCLRERDYEVLKIIENRKSDIKNLSIQVFGREIPELMETI